MRTQTKETQAQLTPAKAIEILVEGNKRFVNNQKADRNLLQQVKETSTGQYPFAIILSCIDSRTSSELIFDLGMGDIFNARIAGNIVNEDILGSMEFACKVAGSKLIVVLGHTKCGAVKGACDHVELGNLTGLVKKIEPSVNSVETEGEKNSSNSEFVEKVAEANVHRMLDEIQEKSSILKEMIEKGEIGIIGGMYDVETGEVDFYEQTFNKSGALNEELAGKR
ncbi:carbonic anhydrase [Pontibacter aydingkolensis]|uniref:Carbonic anhydrase n=1 Tax=Pontibacter aydingkolensis TaxID=1911536 RepID=A0ABS7CV21_9BACT|nr:carbonic anhydrase family protein [Pontibacter aydingkolensis]MBW7467640.1 carbonic anhydrase [Pontibacter aydingkolensis]